jgi:hypothetical protein
MATLTTDTMHQARTLVTNFLATGDIQTPGPAPTRKLETAQDFVDAWEKLMPQFPEAERRRASIRTGTGGALIALLERLPRQVAERLAHELHNNGAAVGYVTVESGARYEIAKSGCSTSDFSDYATRRGLWAGRE